MRAYQANQQRGFTIVEMMLVVAIAGLIMMTVLLSVPALTRAGHNNQRKQDAASILNAVSRYQLNNSGAFPASYNDIKQWADLSWYDGDHGAVTMHPTTAGDPTTRSVTDGDVMEIYNHYVCDKSGSGKAVSDGAGYRDVVALYAIETAHAYSPKCQGLAP